MSVQPDQRVRLAREYLRRSGRYVTPERAAAWAASAWRFHRRHVTERGDRVAGCPGCDVIGPRLD
jgi:hypothetical protein